MIRRYVFDKNFDSLLNYPNQRNISGVELIVKVHLNPFNPGVAGAKEERFKNWDSREYTFQPWSPAEWSAFTAGYKREVEFYLNWPLLGLWLLPTSKGRAESAAELKEFMHDHPISRRFGAVVQCGLTVNLVEKKDAAHVAFDVLRLKDGEAGFRSYVEPRFFGQNGGMLTSRDIQKWPPPGPGKKSHSTVAHELGHALGLEHSNNNDPRCVRGSEDICYGVPGTPQRRNLMGAGTEIDVTDVRPWLAAIRQHARALTWAPTDQMPKETHLLH